MTEKRALKPEEIELLTSRGCRAQDWGQIRVSDGFDPDRVLRTAFLGEVEIGDLSGTVRTPDGIEKECGLYDAVLVDSSVGNGCRVARVGGHIANYDIEDGACLEDIGVMSTSPGASFGNGVEVEVLNEGGGRVVPLFDELSVQFAYLVCLHRWRPAMVEKLRGMALDRAELARSDRGRVGRGACVISVREAVDVRIGPYAHVHGASSLRNGTILSSEEAVTEVGAGVTARDFIIAEGAAVTDGAVITKTFVGQGARVGRQFSAENSLFFANCEAFHGEACSVFAGPYTVTHHKSTLLIAGLFSFYNAGSGTNQSNHMYKLGPVHEGKLGRGTKTGSFSYMMWPCRVGPFSVVIGKHTGTFDTWEYPFSHIEARADGKAAMIPGLNVVTVGTVRDGAKWPKRDRRKGRVKRDKISFAVFSPFLVGLMRRARANLARLQKETDRSVAEVSVGGALVRRPILRTGQKYYRNGIELYLYEKVFERAEKAAGGGVESVREAFASDPEAVYSEKWVDLGGQLMPEKRLRDLGDDIESGGISGLDAFFEACSAIQEAYEKDEWVWVKAAFKEDFGTDLDRVSREELIEIAGKYGAVKSKFLKLVLADAEKEFDSSSMSGFGQDGSDGDAERDFAAVRGGYDGNPFVKEMRGELEELDKRVEAFKARLLEKA